MQLGAFLILSLSLPCFGSQSSSSSYKPLEDLSHKSHYSRATLAHRLLGLPAGVQDVIASFLTPHREFFHMAPVTALAFEQQRKRLVSGGSDSCVYSWNLKNGHREWVDRRFAQVNQVDIHEDTMHISYGPTMTQPSKIVRMRSSGGEWYCGQELKTTQAPAPNCLGALRLVSSSLRTCVVSQRSDHKYQIFVNGVVLTQPFEGPPVFAFDRCTERVAFFQKEKEVISCALYHIASRNLLGRWEVGFNTSINATPLAATWMPGDKEIVIGISSVQADQKTHYTISLFDTQSGNLRALPHAPQPLIKQTVGVVAASSDGKYVCAAGGNTARVFNDAGKTVAQLYHKNKINLVQFHPTNSALIATGSDDHTVRVWKVGNLLQAKLALSRSLTTLPKACRDYQSNRCCAIL